MIRNGNTQDIPAIIDMIERLAASVAGPQQVCRIKTGETLAALMSDPDGSVMVSDGGFIAGRMGQTIISPDRVAFELGWYAEDKSGLRLLREFEARAQDSGARLVKMTCNGGAAQRILEKCGYRTAEVQMVKQWRFSA